MIGLETPNPKERDTVIFTPRILWSRVPDEIDIRKKTGRISSNAKLPMLPNGIVVLNDPERLTEAEDVSMIGVVGKARGIRRARMTAVGRDITGIRVYNDDYRDYHEAVFGEPASAVAVDFYRRYGMDGYALYGGRVLEALDADITYALASEAIPRVLRLKE